LDNSQPNKYLPSLGQEIVPFDAPSNENRNLKSYIFSIPFSKNGKSIAATSPRGGVLHDYNTVNKKLMYIVDIPDVCGVAANDSG
jgi:hypothetical protein|tara:strand:+ start:287 stop:541 length:255 start_codon:yes stop_codon:yes gene_type:complete